MTRYYIQDSHIGPLRAMCVLSTYREWVFTMAIHCRRLFGSRSEAKRALRWAINRGHASARICEEL